jgi:hypothetical protein
MSYTKLAIITKVQQDLDLQEETFIAPAEYTSMLMEAIRAARKIIEGVEEDYFLAFEYVPLVTDVNTAALPTGIHISKIRGMEYDNGSRAYEIRRIRNYDKFRKIAEGDAISGADLAYIMINDNSTDGPKIRWTPAPKETNATAVTCWFLRETKELSADADVCDVPEAIDYIFAHMKGSCLAKENGGIIPAEQQAKIDKAAAELVDDLTNMTPDNDNVLEADFSHYEEHN